MYFNPNGTTLNAGDFYQYFAGRWGSNFHDSYSPMHVCRTWSSFLAGVPAVRIYMFTLS